MEGFTAYMCKTDFEYDARGASDGAKVYPSEAALRRHAKYCGSDRNAGPSHPAGAPSMTDPALLRAAMQRADEIARKWCGESLTVEGVQVSAETYEAFICLTRNAALAAIRDTTERAAGLIEGPGGVYALLASALRRGEHLG